MHRCDISTLSYKMRGYTLRIKLGDSTRNKAASPKSYWYVTKEFRKHSYSIKVLRILTIKSWIQMNCAIYNLSTGILKLVVSCRERGCHVVSGEVSGRGWAGEVGAVCLGDTAHQRFSLCFYSHSLSNLMTNLTSRVFCSGMRLNYMEAVWSIWILLLTT